MKGTWTNIGGVRSKDRSCLEDSQARLDIRLELRSDGSGHVAEACENLRLDRAVQRRILLKQSVAILTMHMLHTYSKVVHEADHDFVDVRDHVDSEGAAQIADNAHCRAADLEFAVVLESNEQDWLEGLEVRDEIKLGD